MTNNPYQTPEGQLTTDDQAFAEIKFFSPAARINRLRYWAHGMLFMIPTYIVLGVSAGLAVGISPVFWALAAIAYLAMIVFGVILMIQRLHDVNKSGWFALLALVPLANIYLMVILIFFAGTKGSNQYGLQPPPNKTWHWILALVFPIVFVGILATVAIPQYQKYVEMANAETEYNQTAPVNSTENPEETTESVEATRSANEVIYSDETIDESADDGITDEAVIDDSGEEAILEEIEPADTPQ